ncbi:MAG: metallophosphoesterase [Patescibacteria group bacterium]|nr:metallophosphoesterase [Patescibacteria group bacterium]
MKYIFFTLNITVALFGHFLMFLIWRYFFGFTDFYLQFALAFILFCGLILLVIAPLLIHWKDNIFSRALYVVGGLWSGLMLNTALAAIFYFLLKYFHLNNFIDTLSNGKYLYILIIPLVMILVEFYCARVIRVKRRSIKIKNLPEFWRGKKIIHVSDVHLGPIWRQKFFDDLTTLINKQRAELVFITGDLFDGMDADFSWFHLRKLEAAKGVFYAYGNHDLILGEQKIIQLFADSNIEILADELREIEGLQVIGISCYYKGRLDVKKKIAELKTYDPLKPSILMYHEPKDVRTFQSAGINVQLSGHTHGGQMFPFNLLAHILYKGFASGLYRLDNFNLSVTSGAGTWGPPLRLGSCSEIVVLELLSA